MVTRGSLRILQSFAVLRAFMVCLSSSLVIKRVATRNNVVTETSACPSLRAIAKRFAIALRLGHAEVSVTTLFRVATLLMTNDDDRQTMKARKTANDCRILSEPLVTMKLDKVFKQPFNQIERVRPISMPCEQHTLERRFLWFCLANSVHFRSSPFRN